MKTTATWRGENTILLANEIIQKVGKLSKVMSGERKYETRCPSCKTIIRVPMDYSGRVGCPNCSFIWKPKNNITTLYVQKPQREFAMTLEEAIRYGISMVPIVVMTILISLVIGWGGLELFAMSSSAEEPVIALCFGILLIAISAIIFVSLTFGIGVKIVAEGVMVGNIASEEFRNKEDNLTTPNPVVNEENNKMVSNLEESVSDTVKDDSEIQSES